MKNVKRFILIAFTLIIAVLVMFNDKLLSYAENTVYTDEVLVDGLTLHSGDPFSFRYKELESCNGEKILLEAYVNGDYYSTYVNEDGTLEPVYYKDTYEDYNTSVNEVAFTQDKPGTLPYINGMNVEWVFNASLYFDTNYCRTNSKFTGKVYSIPKLHLYCDSTTMPCNEEVECQVAMEYLEGPIGVEFDLVADNFEVLDVQVSEDWEMEDNGVYKLIPKDDIDFNEYLDSPYIDDIMTFKLKAKEYKDTSYEDAVVLDNAKYFSDTFNGSYDDELKEPMKVTSCNVVKDEVENPKTGVSTYVALGVVVVLLGAVTIGNIKKKELFRKI